MDHLQRIENALWIRQRVANNLLLLEKEMFPGYICSKITHVNIKWGKLSTIPVDGIKLFLKVMMKSMDFT